MENATKALLIAAAVLIAILIISLGIVIYNQASETINSVNMSGQEIQAFNDQFLKYDGQGKRGTEINALLKTALNNNMSERTENGGNDTARCVVIDGGSTGAAIDATSGTMTKVDSAKVYNVTVAQDGEGGLVHTITITAVN